MMVRRLSNVLASIGAAMITYRCARAADVLFFRVANPPRGEVLLISDIILATAFGAAIFLWLNLRATRSRLTDLERDQIVVDTQMSLAAQIQRHLLPAIPAVSNGVRWAGRLEPAYRIGGDFYDFIPGDAGGLFAVGDVSGKGIPAALLQSSAHSLFRTLARDAVDPADLLTCILVRIDSAARTLVYANAGHPPGLIVGSAGRRLLSRGGPPVGLFPDTAYESETMPVEPGDLGVIVSDGITEAIEEDLDSTVCNIPAPRTPERVCDALMQAAQRGPGPRGVANWQDDRTVLAFLFEGLS